MTFTTELVVSELVTNAIRYGGPPVRLRLIRDTTLVCEVSDTDSTAPTCAAPVPSTKEAVACSSSLSSPCAGEGQPPER